MLSKAGALSKIGTVQVEVQVLWLVKKSNTTQTNSTLGKKHELVNRYSDQFTANMRSIYNNAPEYLVI